jgi:hypothetical protein
VDPDILLKNGRSAVATLLNEGTSRRPSSDRGGPVSGPEHYREAEQLIAAARNTAQASTLESTRQYAQTIAEAQVHAIIALAAATGVSSDSRAWHDVAGTMLSR